MVIGLVINNNTYLYDIILFYRHNILLLYTYLTEVMYAILVLKFLYWIQLFETNLNLYTINII